MREINETQRQLLLYAKGKYKKSRNPIYTDLKKLLGEITGIDPEMFDVFDIYDMVQEAFVDLVDSTQLKMFVANLFRDVHCRTTIRIEDLILIMLSRLALLEIFELDEKGGNKRVLIDLGEPDPNILPPQKKVGYADIIRNHSS